MIYGANCANSWFKSVFMPALRDKSLFFTRSEKRRQGKYFALLSRSLSFFRRPNFLKSIIRDCWIHYPACERLDLSLKVQLREKGAFRRYGDTRIQKLFLNECLKFGPIDSEICCISPPFIIFPILADFWAVFIWPEPRAATTDWNYSSPPYSRSSSSL